MKHKLKNRKCIYSKVCTEYPKCPINMGDETEDYSCVDFDVKGIASKMVKKVKDE